MIFRRVRILALSLLALAPVAVSAATDSDLAMPQPAVECVTQSAPAVPVAVVVSPLAGTPWQLEELKGELLPGKDSAPYLLMTKTDELVGFGGCNYFIGKYHREEEGKILVSSLRASHQQCPETSQRESSLLAALVMANTLRVGNQELTLSLDGNTLLKFRLAPDISADELLQQGRLVKAKSKVKTRTRKVRSKKKKGTSRAKGHHKTVATKAVAPKTAAPKGIKLNQLKPTPLAKATPLTHPH